MFIATDDARTAVVTCILEKVTALGNRLSASDLDWAIRMEDAFNTRGYLSVKQITVLINILAKYTTEE